MTHSVFHPAASRGEARYDWLHSRHTFSFANYHRPDRMHFGVLRVLNDDIVAPGMGFHTHPHKNMEIISIPLSGELEHKDSMGNTAIIREGEVQVMSAGTGVLHSEFNKSSSHKVQFLQIWVIPKLKNVTPRYDQISTADIARENTFYQILSPHQEDQGVWIYQDAWFHMGSFEEGISTSYAMKKKQNGLYIFILQGKLEVEGQILETRDGFGIWNREKVTVQALTQSRVLLMEVPLTL